MFTKYWRSYPWPLQLLLFVLLMMIVMTLGVAVTQKLIPATTGVSLKEISSLSPQSSQHIIKVSHYAQIIGSLSLFTIPCLLFAYLTHPRPFQYLGLRKPGKPIQWLLVAGVMLGFLFLSIYLENLIMSHIKLSKGMQEMQNQNNNQMKGMLSLKSTGGFILTFFSMAILTPFSEEVMFRGTLFRFAHKSTRRTIFPIVITAVLFMFVHENPYGMPFIFIAGVLLACMYYFTGSLWCSILAHFLYNGVQVVYSYIAVNQPAGAVTKADENLPLWLAVSGGIVFFVSLYALIKNKTPLPYNWSDDYLGEQRPEQTGLKF